VGGSGARAIEARCAETPAARPDSISAKSVNWQPSFLSLIYEAVQCKSPRCRNVCDSLARDVK
jgi:hypothetical protein